MKRNPLLNTKDASSFIIYLDGAVTHALLYIELDRFLNSQNSRTPCQIPFALKLSTVVIMVLIYSYVILLIGVSIFVFYFSNGQEHTQGVMKQLNTAILMMVVGCSVFCCLVRVDT